MKKSFYNVFLKRFFDFFLSLLAIVILSPVFLLVYVLSAIILGGDPIFKQYRPGKNGKIFKLYKFRSMSNKKDKDGNLLPDDQRITKWGKILRKTSLDELPQLFNILKGDMSIIGPRPRLVKDFIFYEKEVLEIYNVRPGLTGPAQVYDRNSELSWDHVFKRDREYSQKVTFINDLKLFVGTFLAVFKGGSSEGAKHDDNKREYYYPDQLLKDGKITKSQYNKGLEFAKSLILQKNAKIEYLEDLHNNSGDNYER